MTNNVRFFFFRSQYSINYSIVHCKKRRHTFVYRPIVRNSPLKCTGVDDTAFTMQTHVAFHQRAPLLCVVIAAI